MAGYVAVWALVIATDAEGRQMYAYAGQPINEAITAGEIKRLLADGAIKEADEVEGEPPAKPARKAAPKTAGEPAAEPAAEPVAEPAV